MLRALSFAGFRVILLPRKTSLYPSLVDRIHDVFAQCGVYLSRSLLMWARGLCEVLIKLVLSNTTQMK